MSGGGARASYQVGVVKAALEIYGKPENPFQIICGTSAGAINAGYLASRADNMTQGVKDLHSLWAGLHPLAIYDTTWQMAFRNLFRISKQATVGRNDKGIAVLDNRPLRKLLHDWLDFSSVKRNLDTGALHSLAITAMDYYTGESVTFYQGKKIPPWERAHRRGIYTELSHEHIVASASIPILFPPTRVNGIFYGDGALRQINPLSPAIHLGARRLFIVGVSANASTHKPEFCTFEPPSIAQVAGHLLNREFIDNLEADIETAHRFNHLIDAIADATLSTESLHKLDILVVAPSIPIDEITVKYLHRQPRSMRFLFRSLGAQGRGAGASFASYLMFDGGFCTELMELGYRDAWEQADNIREFLNKRPPLAG
ncbi:MAG TPA: patatin-like phospholipase family protein, partial [Gammaproteobacteria bacterium]|nr:patatin-like phospholipase family protein [Gammaproteobacteria bacterium]